MLFIIIGAVVLLLIVGVVGFMVLGKKQAAAADEEGAAEPVAAAHAPAHDGHAVAPTYLPMDNMVVNLADPGGERVAQVGITLELVDAHAVDTVKGYMPSIRSGVLMLLSKRTAEELLSPEGKQKLIDDILVESSRPFGGGEEEDTGSKKKKKKAAVQYPVTGVLFSSLIVQ
jgi:flagellar FliL protein